MFKIRQCLLFTQSIVCIYKIHETNNVLIASCGSPLDWHSAVHGQWLLVRLPTNRGLPYRDVTCNVSTLLE